MTLYLRLFVSFILSAFFALGAYAAETEPVDTGEALGQIVTSHDVVAPGQTFALGVQLELNPGWHIYWKNPGDSGEPFDVRFDPTPQFTTGDIEWGLPQPQPTGPIINYGYEGRPLFPLSVTVSEDALPGESLKISGLVYYLICADICVPESFEFDFNLPVAAESMEDRRWASNIERARRRLPLQADWPAKGALVDGRLIVEITLPDAAQGDAFYLFPTEAGFINHSDHPQKMSRDGTRLQFSLTPEFELAGGMKDMPALLKWSEDGTEQGVYLTVSSGQVTPLAGAANTSPAGPATGQSAVSIGFLGAVAFALLGGIILNLMPCVFPVIALKAIHVAGLGGEDKARVRFEAWMYAFGVLATFVALVAILLILRAAGQTVGWGIHLQSPVITALLALLFVAIGLSLLGVYEFGTRFQGAGQSLTEGGGARASFFTGALAVIVATPCTAPLMATAIGWAFLQPVPVLMTVMLALGLGFALPFLLLAYLPARWLRLPKPGAWMDTLKQFLAFPMFGAAIWLIWVVTSQTGTNGLLLVLIAALLLAFGIWCLRSERLGGKVIGLLSLLAAIALPFAFTIYSFTPSISAANYGGELNKQPWSAETVAAERAAGRGVFVDFTAAWCVTCKVNERGALADERVKQAFLDTDTAFLIADWTLKDDVIAAELARHGRAGVPLYLYYRPLKAGEVHNDVNPLILPQMLSVDIMTSTLRGQ